MKKEEREKINKSMGMTYNESHETQQKAQYEHITDTAPQGIEWEGLPAGIQDQIENAISDFCLYECKPPVSDLSKERAPRWSACCTYIGHAVYKRYNILTAGENPRRGDGTRKQYDHGIMAASVPAWVFYCARYDKAPLAYDFFNFIGASECYLSYAMRENVTPALLNLAKNLKNIQEAGLAGLISDGRGNPTGAIAILNHWHGWNQMPQTEAKQVQNAISVHDLPRLGGISGENGNP